MRRLTVAAVLVLVIAAAPEARPQAEAEPDRTPWSALSADAPDPEVVFTGRGQVLVFTTNATIGRTAMHVPVWSWTAAAGWDLVGDALPDLPDWTGPGRVWAPAVARSATGRWWLYFTSQDLRSGRQCIGLAVADRAEGPYRTATGSNGAAGPVVCDAPEGGSIDASVFTAPDGGRWLLWKTDGNVLGRPSTIKSVALTTAGAPAGPVSVLLRSVGGWDRGVIEAPQLLSWGDRLVLLHSGGRYVDDSYAMSTAVCEAPSGPCRPSSPVPQLASGAGLVGPGGGSVAVDAAGTPQLVFHSWARTGDGGRYRGLSTVPVDLDGGRLRFRTERRPVGRPDGRPRITIRPVLSPLGAGDREVRFGGAGGQHLACDLDGDGVDSPVWFDRGAWHRAGVPVGDGASLTHFGRAGDLALCADFDADGSDERIVHRDGYFHLGPEVVGHPSVIAMGGSDTVAVAGDWDGDGDADPGTYHPATGRFTLRPAADRVDEAIDAAAGAVPVIGDWDGDGTTDVGTYDGTVFLLHLRGGASVLAITVREGGTPISGRFSPVAPTDSVGVVHPSAPR